MAFGTVFVLELF